MWSVGATGRGDTILGVCFHEWNSEREGEGTEAADAVPGATAAGAFACSDAAMGREQQCGAGE